MTAAVLLFLLAWAFVLRRPALAGIGTVHGWGVLWAGTEERPSLRAHRGRKSNSKGIRKIIARSSAAHLRFVGLLIGVGTVLRVLRINDPITYDEAFAYTGFSTLPLGDLLSNYISPVNHVLHTLLVKISTGVFGVHLWSLRLPALVAGVLAMPVFYLVVRQLFNRYIALIALSLVAVSGPLVEYSAMARGYSLSWLFLLLALLAGRRFAKTNTQSSACLIAVFLALGMWAVPTTIYGALMVYIWLLLYILLNYSSSRAKRNGLLLLSFILFLALSFVLYAGVILMHGIAPLLRDPSLGDGAWSAFVRTHADKVGDLWVYFTASASEGLAIAGWIGVVYAAYVSSKYRILLFAIVLGTVPLVLLQHVVGNPCVWTYSLFFLHLGSAIALFYALKFVQAKLLPQLGKRVRTGVVSLLLMVLFGALGFNAKDKLDRFPEAVPAAAWLKVRLHTGDRVLADLPWDAPLEFHLRAMGADPDCVLGASGPGMGGRTYVVVGTAFDHTPESVLEHFGRHDIAPASLQKLEDWRRLEIFAAP